MLADNYPWLEDTYASLVDNPANAVLLHGKQYIGKYDLANELIAAWLCTNNDVKWQCHKCNSCIWFAADSNPDLIRIEPNKNNIISLEAIEDVAEFTSITTHIAGKHKIVFLYAVETLNKYAANALLKTLEEPSSNCIFILVSHRLDGVLPTIRSRCQTIQIMPPSREESYNWLLKKQIDQSTFDKLITIFPQQPLLALKIAQDDSTNFPDIVADIQALLTKQVLPVYLASSWSELDINITYSLIWSFCNEVLYLKHNLISLENARYINAANSDYINSINQAKLFVFIDNIQESIGAIQQGYNLNKKLLLTDLFTQMQNSLS